MDLINPEYFVTFAASGILGTITNALSVILGLGAVIFFHELGHFAVAKWCDVHVERFSIGIGPIIWSRQKGETEYALSILPFGGYVKMLGQDDMDPAQMTSNEIAENPRAYSSKKVWQRMAIISAGVIMNVITGFLFFATAYFFGVVEQVEMIGSVSPGSPAWVNDIRPGDTIEKIDGKDITKFSEINRSVVLSSDSLRVKGKHADGTPFDKVIQPKRGKDDYTRRIGCGTTLKSILSKQNKDADAISLPGFAAWKSGKPFQPGDRIVAVNGEPVKYLHEMAYLTAKYASEDIVYTTERTTGGDSKSDADADAKTETVEITIPPMKARSIGLRMAIGKVTILMNDSIAQSAGMQVDDQIIKVDGMEVGADIDPLRLPNYFAEKAGIELEVVVNRPRTGDSAAEVSLKMVPKDAAGWSERALGGWDGKKGVLTAAVKTPLTIPAIGAGFQVQPRIAHIIPGSEADKCGKFQIGQKISKVLLEHPDPKKIEPDLLGDKETAALDLSAVEGEPNWAWIFHLMQSAPTRQVRIHVGGDESNGSGSFGYLFREKETSEDHYLPTRGIIGFEELTRVRVAEGLADAASLGFRETESSGVGIYLTLRSLVQGNLSVRALSGPLGIIKIGYTVADSGITRLLMFLGFLSINLAVLNFLPIPVLDGGHMVFLIWEAVARRKPNPKVIDAALRVGLIFIITLFIFVLYLDIFVNGLNS